MTVFAQQTKTRLQKAFKDTLAQWPRVKAQEMKRLDKAGQEGNLFAIKEIITRYPNEAIHWQEPESGLSALHWAAIGRRGDIVAWLLEQGADMSPQDKQGLTALHYAAQAIDIDALNQLLAAGAAIETRNDRGETPLMFAAERNKPDNIRLLVMAGADIHAQNNNGDTPHKLCHRSPDRAAADAMDWAIAERQKIKTAAEKAVKAQEAAYLAQALQVMTQGTTQAVTIKKPLRLKNQV